MREIIINDEPSKPIDSFRVNLSNVRASLRVAEARPVVLSFAFDNYWHAETNVFREESVEPVWKFNADSFRGVDGTKLTEPKSQGPHFRPAPRGMVPNATFTYETEFGYKLHRKFLVVKLSERSPYQDVEWGTAVLPLDSIARGCEAVDLSIIAKDGVTCYGNVYFNVTMTNIQRVRAHLTDLKLSEYPEAYSYDVKLIYLEFGKSGFEKGFSKCTEKRSDAEPRFSAQPALEWDTTLHDMLTPSTTDSPALKIFFSVHRQVARNRTEQIGVGALPVRMLFSKVKEGWMDLPTKFKVPLANYKGVIRGKVLLRNIPQFSQLPGSDLVNVDGMIMPNDVDLESRKILPWVKLPKSGEVIAPPHAGTAIAMPTNSKNTLAGTVANSLENFSEPSVGDSRRDDVIAKMNVNGGSAQNFHSPVTESGSDGGSVSSRATSPARNQPYQQVANTAVPQSVHRGPSQAVQHGVYEPREQYVSTGYGQQAEVSARNEAHVADHNDNLSKLCTGVENLAVSHLDQIRMIGALRNAQNEEVTSAGQADTAGRPVHQRQRSDGSGSSRRRTSVVSDEAPDARELPWLRGRTSKSGKSIGSAGTADGGVEIGSVVLSEEGYATGSRTTTEDALTPNHRLNPGPPPDDGADDGDADSTLAAAAGSGAQISEVEEDEWMAIPDPVSQRYYFVSQDTQESLWLPPDWERMEDEEGRQYFVDHGARCTQRAFPAREARAYRESVYAG